MSLTYRGSKLAAQLPTLVDIAVAGFPGWVLGDLLALMDELFPYANEWIVGTNGEEREAGATVLDVICQASDAATVQGGMTSDVEQLNLLRRALQEFEVLIDRLLKHSSLSSTTIATAKEFKNHVVMRLGVVNRQILCWTTDDDEESAMAGVPEARRSVSVR